jgi:hypothetical protein
MKIKPISVVSKRILSSIPYKHVVVSTSLSLDKAVELFSGSISPIYDPIWQSPPPNLKKLQGNATKDRFKIRPTSYYRGSAAYVSGKFIPTKDGVNIDMYAYPSPVAFIMILSGVIVLLGSLVSAALGGDYSVIIWGLLATIIFTIGFVAEVDDLDWHISNLVGNSLLENKKENS